MSYIQGKYTFILRDAGDGKHALVGESYLYGMMDGEMIAEAGEGTLFSLAELS